MRSPTIPPRRGLALRDSAAQRPIAGALNLDALHLEAIERSHQRCAALGLTRIERPDLGLIALADLDIARERNRKLHAHAAPVMELLYGQIVNSESMVVLTDSTGTIIHAIGDDDFLARAEKVALKPGAVWSEEQKGTNAVGTALVAEVPTLVHADEHFFHANHFLTCSAAPILDPRGNILGVLDVSGDRRSYHQHTMALVKMSARMIENRWLSDDYRDVMRLHFHQRVDFIGTLMEGIIAVKPDGRIVGANRGALEQLAMSGATLRMQSLQALFGTDVGTLVDRFRSPLATPLLARSVGGRSFYLHARFDWPVWTSLAEAVAVQAPAAPSAAHASETQPIRQAEPSAPVCADPQAALVQRRLQRAFEHGIPTLLIGETGSGKQCLARAAHQVARPSLPWRTLSCNGATSADVDAALGWVPGGNLAGATLCLHDIGALSETAQARLMNLLDQDAALAPQQRAMWVCTSRDEPAALLQAGRLREDLYYRLNGLTVHLPPLRERCDLAELAAEMLAREWHRVDDPARPVPRLAAATLVLLRRHPWPGNVRQLFNVLRAALLLAEGAAEVTVAHLPQEIAHELGELADATMSSPLPAQQTQSLDELERSAIERALQAAHGNISAASKQLGISRNTIYRKLRWNDRN